MAGNSNLHDSRNAKADEFYTPLSMIENELKHYKEHFCGKTVPNNAVTKIIPADFFSGADLNI